MWADVQFGKNTEKTKKRPTEEKQSNKRVLHSEFAV
jgi:hypothetical protein